MLAKKLLTGRPENWIRSKKRKKTRMALAKPFALSASAKSAEGLLVGS